MTPSEQYCFDLVRLHDKDRFLASLFAPDEKRPLLLALYAFNLEVARIRDSMSEPHLGEIRQLWWRESLDDLYSGRSIDHPVLLQLNRAVTTADLPKTAFTNVIDARQFDLYADPMPSLGDLEGYLGETSSSLIQLAAMILIGGEARQLASIAGLGGVAYGLAGLLRVMPLHRARGQCFLPRDVMARHGVQSQDFIAGSRPAELFATVKELADMAEGRLDQAGKESARIPREALPAFHYVGLTPLYLAKLRNMGPEALTKTPEVAQWRRQIRLLRLGRANRFV